LPENWNNYVEQIIKEKNVQRRHIDFSFNAQIFIWEEQWENLFNLVKHNVSFGILESYEKYLLKDYSNEISDIYQTQILQYMKTNISRNHYQAACRYLRKMKKMGAKEKANFVIQQLKTLYPQRKALMEELEKV
jgi:hypothetical protein